MRVHTRLVLTLHSCFVRFCGLYSMIKNIFLSINIGFFRRHRESVRNQLNVKLSFLRARSKELSEVFTQHCIKLSQPRERILKWHFSCYLLVSVSVSVSKAAFIEGKSVPYLGILLQPRGIETGNLSTRINRLTSNPGSVIIATYL